MGSTSAATIAGSVEILKLTPFQHDIKNSGSHAIKNSGRLGDCWHFLANEEHVDLPSVAVAWSNGSVKLR